MPRKSFPILNGDSHIVEPPAIWDEYVPRDVRAWVKTQFHFHTDTDVLLINGRAVPASRERSNAAEVGWPGWSKNEVGALTPGTPQWQGGVGAAGRRAPPRARGRGGGEGEVRPPGRLPRPARTAGRHGRPRRRPGDAVPLVVRAPAAGA